MVVLRVPWYFFMHHITRLLETNSYVRCLLIDFSKAFDVVDHGILTGLDEPPAILSGIFSFLTGMQDPAG